MSGGNAVLKTTLAITNLQKGLAAASVETGPDVEHNLRFLFSAYGPVSATSVIVDDTTEVSGGRRRTCDEAPIWFPLSLGFAAHDGAYA